MMSKVAPDPRPRQGWEESFRLMAQAGDDVLLDDVPFALSDWDVEEWEWQQAGLDENLAGNIAEESTDDRDLAACRRESR